jgi:hypothetical protein
MSRPTGQLPSLQRSRPDRAKKSPASSRADFNAWSSRTRSTVLALAPVPAFCLAVVFIAGTAIVAITLAAAAVVLATLAMATGRRQ